MGVAHHSAYVPWLEVARVDWLREAGFDYAKLEQEGTYFPVTELHVRYKLPARFDEELLVEAWLEAIGSRKFVMAYRILRGDRELARATTVHVAQDVHGRARRMPADLLEALTKLVMGRNQS